MGIPRNARNRDGVIAKIVGNEMVLLDYERGIYYGLNEVGARVWQGFSAGAPIADVIDQILIEFEVAREVVEADVNALLEDLADKGLIEFLSGD